ncbi:helix-turn-helix transcriptional regulator [Acinetobacter sp. CFCC 10889]|uniref:helix-turn-helix transcriptional regulator n=1 Tax=Acinetobacter sp. CFCC 10889 TaxID=1775557 RepID=UPI000DD0A747|nr:AlpA family phage regulatory protein [Acinetobacter sp. CFCC 10889]
MNSLSIAHNIESIEVPNNKIIRLKQVVALTGLSRSTIYDRMDPKSKRYDASFPKSIRLGTVSKIGAVGWIESEIQAWIKKKIEER